MVASRSFVMLTITVDHPVFRTSSSGAVAQLGARVNGIHEVAGSIPDSYTNFYQGLSPARFNREL